MIFDADNHYYEPQDCFTRFMPSDRMEEAIRVVLEGEAEYLASIGALGLPAEEGGP